MQIVPVTDQYSQTLRVSLGGQDCRIDLRQCSTGLYCTLYVDDVVIVAGALCLDRNTLVRSLYLGFIGDLAFADLQGTSDPSSPGLGTRFVLCYFSPSELVP